VTTVPLTQVILHGHHFWAAREKPIQPALMPRLAEVLPGQSHDYPQLVIEWRPTKENYASHPGERFNALREPDSWPEVEALLARI
jgi:hypothetical protein